MNFTLRSRIIACGLVLPLLGGGTCFAQWGTNASPYDNSCKCLAPKPFVGYYQTRWHPWPCAPGPAGPRVQSPTAGQEVPPSQIELPNPKEEGDVKAQPFARPQPSEPPIPPSGEETPGKLPEEAPGSATPPKENANPLEPGAESQPDMKAPGTEPPSGETPKEPAPLPGGSTTTPGTAPSSMPEANPFGTQDSIPPGTGNPPNRIEPSAPKSNDSNAPKSSNPSPLGPDESPFKFPGSSQNSPQFVPDQLTSASPLHLRGARTAAETKDVDPPPVLPVALEVQAALSHASPLRRCANDVGGGAETISNDFLKPAGTRAEPELIVPSLDTRPLETAKRDEVKTESMKSELPKVEPLTVRPSDENPLRSSTSASSSSTAAGANSATSAAIHTTQWTAVDKKIETKPVAAIRPESDDRSTVDSHSNPLR